MSHSPRRLLMLACALMALSYAQFSTGQSINQQKKAVVFIFGTVHPINPDRSAITGARQLLKASSRRLGSGTAGRFVVPARA